MRGARRILTALAAATVCTIAVGLMLEPDPPERLDLRGSFQFDQHANRSAGDPYPEGWDRGFGAIGPAAESVSPARPVYRHSVVPGGVYSRAEVQEAVFRRADVAEHYRNVNVHNLAPARVSKDGLYYASYRRDNSIYWTSYRLRVDPTETVLGDGEHLVRARCGNLLSAESLRPILPTGIEPTEPEFSLIDAPTIPMLDSLSSPGGFWLPFLPIIPVLIFSGGGSHGDGPGPGPGPGPEPTPEPTPEPVPEPAPAGLVGIGLAVIIAARSLAARRSREARQRKDWPREPTAL